MKKLLLILGIFVGVASALYGLATFLRKLQSSIEDETEDDHYDNMAPIQETE